MALLLDTHILVWIGKDDPRLKPRTRAIIDDDPALLVSSVVAWEFMDLNARRRFGSDLRLMDLIVRFGMTVIGFPDEAWRLAEELPDIHRDPVDRMLIGHALHADIPIVTSDERIRQYPAATVWS